MTTVAYRSGVLASDSKISTNDVWTANTSKVFKNYRGELLGICGDLATGIIIREWFMDGRVYDQPTLTGAHGLLITPDETVYAVYAGVLSKLEAPYHATGSGFELALGAMAMGADAEEAVKIACVYDNGSELPLHVVKLGPESTPASPHEPESFLSRMFNKIRF